MDAEKDRVMSGETTPDGPRTASSIGRPRSNSQETVLTAITEITVESGSSMYYPDPPLNSPQARSAFGDGNHVNGLNADRLADKLQRMPTHLTPPSSVRSDQDRQRAENVTPTPRKMDRSLPAEPEFPEHSSWDAVAEEDVTLGLKRLARLARDEYKKDSSRSVEDYYGERLSKLIEEGEVHFDCGRLH